MSYRNRERVKKVLGHKEADRVPYLATGLFDFRFEIADALNLTGDRREFCVEGDFRYVEISPTFDLSDFRPYFDAIPDDAVFNEWGIGEQPLKNAAGYHVGNKMFYPLAKVNTIEELKAFPFPDFASRGAADGLEEQVRTLKSQGYTVVAGMSRTILETAYDMRGIPELFADFYERPKYVELLFERIFEQRLFQARRFAEAGGDVLGIGDDIAMQTGLMISLDMYREKIKPLHAAVIAEARKLVPDMPVNYHSDGKLTALVPDLIDIGVTCINPVQAECMDLVEIKKEYGNDLTLWGCLPVQSVFAHGSRNDIECYLEFLMKEIAVGGGLVVDFINFVGTNISIKNAETFIELFYDIGKYR
jgi:uroporphyrinogen decarboxylase